VVRDVVEQRRLPHAGLAADHESPTLAITHGVDEPFEFVAFSPPAEQLHGATSRAGVIPPQEEHYAAREMSLCDAALTQQLYMRDVGAAPAGRTIAWSHDDEFSSRDRSLTAKHTAEGRRARCRA
jgi:hypothetical protein